MLRIPGIVLHSQDSCAATSARQVLPERELVAFRVRHHRIPALPRDLSLVLDDATAELHGPGGRLFDRLDVDVVADLMRRADIALADGAAYPVLAGGGGEQEVVR